jgi:hypothetical protein
MSEKFTDSIIVEDWEVLTPDGYRDIMSFHKTIEFEVWEISTDSFTLKCADDHIVMKHGMVETFVKDISIGDMVLTENGLETVISVNNLGYKEPMYDIQVNDFSQLYYSNGIVSHNTACAALYLLWYAMFVPDTNILVAAHKGSGAAEIMDRIRYAYEECPDHIRCGVTTYASGRIVFDNKSSIVAQTTTENTGRGLSISLLYCLDAGTMVRVRDKETKEEKDISLETLYTELNGDEFIEFKKQAMLRVVFEDDYYVDVPESYMFTVNDIKTTIENITHGDEILIGNEYFKVVDIQAI